MSHFQANLHADALRAQLLQAHAYQNVASPHQAMWELHAVERAVEAFAALREAMVAVEARREELLSARPFETA